MADADRGGVLALVRILVLGVMMSVMVVIMIVRVIMIVVMVMMAVPRMLVASGADQHPDRNRDDQNGRSELEIGLARRRIEVSTQVEPT